MFRNCLEQLASQRTILHAPGCEIPEVSIKQGQGVLTKFFSMFDEIFKELDQIHDLSAVAIRHQREEWTHHPHHAVVTNTEYRKSDK